MKTSRFLRHTARRHRLTTDANPARGDVWAVRFDPSEGDEIRKVRPAVVMTTRGAGRMRLQIVVPITGWQPQFERYFWMVRLDPTPENGLDKPSAADSFQVKSISLNRFQERWGSLTDDQVKEIAAGIALCVGYSP
ncbi:MAG: type II toxin-antitoxin system PemK/MazF family toxin [Anaerolineae bacterium]|nr:type II toxin-antitoxin system PemK/MazF family toxin [Anaerolineae bacterium]